ncbi:MAG: divalent metal cation transporter, partial [Pseudomonadota bacterium]
MANESSEDIGYPIGERTPAEKLDAEAALLERVQRKPFFFRLPTYLKLGGPGFMGAAATLGAGTLTSAMLSGSQFGYKLLWISWLSVGSGLFMLAAMARFTTRGGFPIIRKQRERYGPLIASLLTAFVGMALVSIVFNFGQVALGAHLMESIGNAAGVPFPQEINWVLYVAVTAWMSLSYGRGEGTGVALVERFMKLSLLLMVACFAACLFVVGIDWPAALHGFFVPWLPRGAMGVDLFIASSAAAIGVLDWVFFQYAGLIKGWGRRHESLARV